METTPGEMSTGRRQGAARVARNRFPLAILALCALLTLSCAPAPSQPLPATPAPTTQESPTLSSTPAPPPAAESTPAQVPAGTAQAAVPAPSPSPTPGERGALILDQLVDRPLADLSPAAELFLEGREGRAGAAVLVPGTRSLYAANGDQMMSMASVVKVAIMMAVLDRAMREGREVTPRELDLLGPMIQESDNDATTILWNDVGGGTVVESYVRSLGIEEIVPNPQDMWGASRASARAVAQLFGMIAFGEVLDPPRRRLALELLSGVVPSQRWGVTAGVPDELPEGTVVGVKDGWYPAGFGWWVNSAGMLIPGDDRPAYAIAVLTRGQPSWEYGIATIEGVAKEVHKALHGPPAPQAAGALPESRAPTN